MLDPNDKYDRMYLDMQDDKFGSESLGETVATTMVIALLMAFRIGLFLGFCALVYLIGSALVG